MPTPFEFLAILDDAIAQAPRGRRAIALELHTGHGGVLLGATGTPLGSDDGGPVYGYTRRQCEAMRQVILDAARDDLGGTR